MSIKNILRASKLGAVVLASIIGILAGSRESSTEFAKDKGVYVLSLAIIFIVFNSFVEIIVSRKLRIENPPTGVKIAGNPFLKAFLLRVSLLAAGGWIVFSRFELGGAISYIVLSVLVAIFVGAVFESCRLLSWRR
jgi:hypothetical protein